MITNNTERLDRKKLQESMARFGNAMSGLTKSSEKQTEILSKMLDYQIDSKEEKKRKEDQEKVREDPIDERKSVGWSSVKGAAGRVGDFARDKFSMVSTWIARALTLGALTPIISKSLKNVIEAAMEKVGINPVFSENIAEKIGASVSWGMIGLIFGKKVGLAFAAGSILWKTLNDTIDIDSKIQEIGEKIGFDVSPAVASGIGTSLTAALILSMPGLISKGISGAFALATTGAKAVAGLVTPIASSLAPHVSTGLLGGFKFAGATLSKILPGAAAIAIVGLYSAYGDDAKKWLEEQAGMSPNWSNAAVDTASFAAAGATLGMMFGPGGAIVGGIVGLIAGLGKSIYTWFSNRRKIADEAAKKAANDIDNQTKIKEITAEPDAAPLNTMVDIQKDAGANPYTHSVETGKAMSVMDLVSPLANISDVTKEEQNSRAIALKNSVEKLMQEYQGSTDDIESVVRAIYVLESAKKDLEEIRKQNPLAVSGTYNDTVTKSGKRVLKFAAEKLPAEKLDEYFPEGLPKFKTGTKGFQDFGTESFALLHGKEAVVPDGTDAAEVLKKFFNDDWELKSKIEESPGATFQKAKVFENADSGKSKVGNIIYSPTNYSPITTIHKGNSINNSRVSSLGGFGDLDDGLPGGVF